MANVFDVHQMYSEQEAVIRVAAAVSSTDATKRRQLNNESRQQNHTWHLSAASSAVFQIFWAFTSPSRTSLRAVCSSRTADVSPVAPSAMVVPRFVSDSSSVALRA